MSSEGIESVRNLGPQSAAMLRQAGFRDRQALAAAGPVVAYLAVLQTGATPSLNLLWALAAGLEDQHWTKLSSAAKESLRKELTAMLGETDPVIRK